MDKKTLTQEEKLKQFKQYNLKTQKTFGKSSSYVLGDMPIEPIKRIKTGSLLLDNIMGGGYPVGRIVEIYGPESSGKTTLALHAIAEVQKNGGLAAFCDAEQAFDPVYAEKLGVNVKQLIFTQPDNGEDALQVVEDWICSGLIDLVVVDSVAALTPKAEIDGDMSDQQMGLLARLMAKALRKITTPANNNECTVIFLNQLREKIGVMYGNPETTTGGRALKFYSSVRMDIRRKDSIKNGSETIGNITNVKIVKNKTFPPYKTATLDIYYGKGIDNEGAVVDIAIEKGIIEKTGAWFSVKDVEGLEDFKCQGKENMKAHFAEDKAQFNTLVGLISEEE